MYPALQIIPHIGAYVCVFCILSPHPQAAEASYGHGTPAPDRDAVRVTHTGPNRKDRTENFSPAAQHAPPQQPRAGTAHSSLDLPVGPFPARRLPSGVRLHSRAVAHTTQPATVSPTRRGRASRNSQAPDPKRHANPRLGRHLLFNPDAAGSAAAWAGPQSSSVLPPRSRPLAPLAFQFWMPRRPASGGPPPYARDDAGEAFGVRAGAPAGRPPRAGPPLHPPRRAALLPAPLRGAVPRPAAPGRSARCAAALRGAW